MLNASLVPPTIETARLRLRPLHPHDRDALHGLWTDPDVRRYLFDDVVIPPERVDAEIARSMESFRQHGFGMWCVRFRRASSLVGFAGYRHFHEPPELQLLYGIGPRHWGRGLATEAARAVIRYGFESLSFERIVASADAPNTASLRVMEKAGMRPRNRLVLNGLDTQSCELRKADWSPGDEPYRVCG